MNPLNIVIQNQFGTLMRYYKQISYTEKLMTFHLGPLKRDFDANVLDDFKIDNMDETHFSVNMDNRYTLAFKDGRKIN